MMITMIAGSVITTSMDEVLGKNFHPRGHGIDPALFVNKQTQEMVIE